MKNGQLTTFLFRGERLTVVPGVRARDDFESYGAGRAEASSLIERWCRDPETWPHMLALYEQLTGERLFGRPDVDGHVVATLRRALRRGSLMIGQDTLAPSGSKEGEGVHTRAPEKAKEPAPPPQRPRTTARRINEKTFVDVRIVDTGGKGLSGCLYKFQLPDGRVREGKLDATGRLQERDIDPGIARLHILAAPGDVVNAEDLGTGQGAGAE